LTSAYAQSPSCPRTYGAWPAPATLTSAVSRSQCVQNDCSMRWGRVIVRTPTIACEERAFAAHPAASLAAGFHAISTTTTGSCLIQGRSWPTRPSLSGLRKQRTFAEWDRLLEFLVGPERLNVTSTRRKRRVSAPFYYLFCWLRRVLHRDPVLVGAADIFSFILAPLIGPILRMVHIAFAVDDGESLRIDCIFVAALV
jgi:hypothetical protein